jgi:hypothetical protein
MNEVIKLNTETKMNRLSTEIKTRLNKPKIICEKLSYIYTSFLSKSKW